jgi:hypothetical protein
MKNIHLKNFSGLRERPTYLELIDYIENNNDKIKMPDRRATFLRKSFYLSQLDGEGTRIQEQMDKERKKREHQEMLIRQFAEDFNFRLRDIRHWLDGQGLVPERRRGPSSYGSSEYNPIEDQPSEAEEANQEQERNVERFMTPQRAVGMGMGSTLQQRAQQQGQRGRRRGTIYQSIATPESRSPQQFSEERRTLQHELHEAATIAQQAADAGVPSSSTFLRRTAEQVASGASATAATTVSALASGAPQALRAVGVAGGAVLGALPGVVSNTAGILNTMTEGVVQGVGIGARAVPLDYVFRRRSGMRGDLPLAMGDLTPEEIFQMQQDVARMDPESYAYFQPMGQLQIPVQTEIFEGQAGTASSSSLWSAPVSAPVPPLEPIAPVPPTTVTASESSSAPASSSAPTSQKRVTSRSAPRTKKVTEISELVDVSLNESPNEGIRQRVDTLFSRVATKDNKDLQNMLSMILARIQSGDPEPKTLKNTRLTLTGMYKDLERIFFKKAIDPEDTNMQQLIVSYYTLKKLQREYNIPMTTTLKTLSTQSFA